jgi:2-C-methyl-D-erythritol 4-phosphate cytidylyltransferase
MRLVRGEYSNMKIINPYDLEVANALLKERGGA